MKQPHTLRLGTRGSPLARAQSQQVADDLERVHADLRVELIVIRTTGDVVLDRPLADVGGKGLFTKEIEQALLRGEIDLAVHSYKDVPVTQPLVEQAALTIAAVPVREDARDVLIGRSAVGSLEDLPLRSTVATGSLRRACQLLEARPDLTIVPVRGNVDTRLKKLREGTFDYLVLAAAGLRRVGLFDSATMVELNADIMTPSPGQGALALQTRLDDRRTVDLLRPLHDDTTATCVDLEREVVRLLNCDCHSPIGVYATIQPPVGTTAVASVTVVGALGGTGGAPPIVRCRSTAEPVDGTSADVLAKRVATMLSIAREA